MKLWQVDFEISSNADWEDAVPMLDADGGAVNLAGATLRMAVKDKTGVIALDLTTANGRLSFDAGAPSTLKILVLGPVITALPAGGYQHDLLLTRAGRTTRVFFGTLRILKGVTPWL